jgi:aspartate kinase
MTAAASSIVVVKLGGSVLRSLPAFHAAAAFLAAQTRGRVRRWVAVVSAEYGHTDALAEEARTIIGLRQPDPAALDLLWATGELRSVALLTLALKAAGVSAVGLNAHETGLRQEAGTTPPGIAVNSLTLRAAIARHCVVVVPGFLATRHQQFVTLGRGGSDLSAVVLAAALEAEECVLVKDVDGYFTDDPATSADAERIPSIDYDSAIAMADAGCPLVQRQALVAAEAAGVSLVVRSLHGCGTVVSSAGN